jgi:CPA1 family monovalent cation:H+ antiporter
VLFTCSLIAPYLAFAGAHAVHASGVLAVVTAGFLVSWHIHVVAADTRYQLYAVWRMLAYLVDGLSFVLVGTTLPQILDADAAIGLNRAALAGVCATLAVVAVRFLWVYQTAYLAPWLFPKLRERQGGYPAKRNVALVAWCGMRGAVSLAAALSIPKLAGGEPFPGRDFVIACTVFVVLGTLIFQGMTLQPLIRLLGIRDDQRAAEEERLARIGMIQAALARLDELKSADRATPEALAHAEAEYLERLNLLIDSIARQYSSTADEGAAPPGAAGLFETELEAVRAERACLLELRDSARINDATQAALQEELDIAEMRLRTNFPPTN